MRSEYFYCYSPKLCTYLLQQGQRYICAGLNESTLNKFWQFKKSAELDVLLAHWRDNKPTA